MSHTIGVIILISGTVITVRLTSLTSHVPNLTGRFSSAKTVWTFFKTSCINKRQYKPRDHHHCIIVFFLSIIHTTVLIITSTSVPLSWKFSAWFLNLLLGNISTTISHVYEIQYENGSLFIASINSKLIYMGWMLVPYLPTDLVSAHTYNVTILCLWHTSKFSEVANLHQWQAKG